MGRTTAAYAGVRAVAVNPVVACPCNVFTTVPALVAGLAQGVAWVPGMGRTTAAGASVCAVAVDAVVAGPRHVVATVPALVAGLALGVAWVPGML